MARKVFVTGLGIVTGIGISVHETFTSLLNGRSGVGTTKYLKTNHKDIPCSEVPFEHKCFPRQSIKRNWRLVPFRSV